jgi:hypothetical protein
MDRKSDLLEFTDEYLDFFMYMSEWKGVQHTAVPLMDPSRLTSSHMELVVATVVATVAIILAEDHNNKRSTRPAS